jgi:hypothetical protein
MELFARDECIFYVKELISQDLCRTFIALYEDDPRKHPGYTASAGGDKQLEVNVKVPLCHRSCRLDSSVIFGA